MSSTNDQLQVQECTWDEFITRVRGSDDFRIFRGQRDPAWKLCAPSDRELLKLLEFEAAHPQHRLEDRSQFENRLRFAEWQYLTPFKDLAVGCNRFDSASLTSVWDWWAIGRHYGLLTPLLDWTKSPYVAAFFGMFDFAESTNPGFRTTGRNGFQIVKSRVSVWALQRCSELMDNGGSFRIFESRTPSAYRQKAQSGLFTCLDQTECIDMESYLRERGLLRLLKRFDIDTHDIRKAITDLDLMNITMATMFPDLEGAAARANQGSQIRMMGARFASDE